LGLPLLTVCNTCTLMLRQAKAKLDGGKKETVNKVLATAGMEYKGVSQVTHLLWVLIRDYGLDNLAAKVRRPLTGLKVAGFYGCHILRPPKVMNFEDYANPSLLEDVIKALGAEAVEFDAKLKCCGFHAFWTAEKDTLALTGAGNASAVAAGADCVVTPCPLCQMQLDMYQPEGRKVVGSDKAIAVLHLAQLVGLALDLAPQDLGLERHVTDTGPILKKY
jgi:succinate dehydrogenase / fumarate reductase cytochrome b subunit